MGLPFSSPSLTRRAVSLRPIIPAAPVIRMCMSVRSDGVGLKRHPAVDEMCLAGNVACLVADEEEGKR